MIMLAYCIFGVLLIIALVTIITVVLTKYYKKPLKNYRFVYLGKLSDNSKDDIAEAVKYLKLTNSIIEEDKEH